MRASGANNFGLFPLGKIYQKGLVVAIAYALSGKLALLLAIPPGYSTPVFPPSGIALAAVLLVGYPMAIGVWFGSFLLNLSLTPINPGTLAHSLLIAGGIGLGAMFQAMAATWLIRRFVGFPNPLIRTSEILKFLILGGPVASLVNATWSSTLLQWGGVISKHAHAFTWWNWWVGDTMGAVMIATILLTFFCEPKALWVKRRFSIGIPLCVTILVNGVIFFHTDSWQQKSIRLEFERAANIQAAQIRRSFEGYLDCLHALESVLVATNEKDRNAFRLATARWISLYPGIYAIAWIPRVFDQKRSEFEVNSRWEGDPNFEIRELGPDGKLMPVPRRLEYYPSLFAEPFRKGVTILGYDLASSPERYQTMMQAMDTGKATATDQIKLIQDVSERVAIIVFLPIYRGDHSTVETRRKNLVGFANISLRMHDVIAASLKDDSAPDFKVAIYDGIFPRKKLLYSQIENQGEREFTKENMSRPLDVVPWETEFTLGDKRFWLDVVPTNEYWLRQKDDGPWVILGSGLLMSGLLVAFLLVITGHSFIVERELLERKRIAEQLRRNTEQLSRSNADLEQFAYVASHDLQEPLRVISIYIQLLQKRCMNLLDEENLTYMNYAIDGAGRMRALIQDLLEYSRVGRTGEQGEDIPIGSVVEQVIQDLRVSIEEKRAAISVGEMPTLNVVRMEWVQLFQNLLGNAIKYGASDRPPVIEIKAEQEGGQWVFSVQDNGIGIPTEFRERIFLVFQRLHGKEAFEGTGIGLAICKKIVEHFGGRIWVEGVLGEGSIFKFSFPIGKKEEFEVTV